MWLTFLLLGSSEGTVGFDVFNVEVYPGHPSCQTKRKTMNINGCRTFQLILLGYASGRTSGYFQVKMPHNRHKHSKIPNRYLGLTGFHYWSSDASAEDQPQSRSMDDMRPQRRRTAETRPAGGRAGGRLEEQREEQRRGGGQKKGSGRSTRCYWKRIGNGWDGNDGEGCGMAGVGAAGGARHPLAPVAVVCVLSPPRWPAGRCDVGGDLNTPNGRK